MLPFNHGLSLKSGSLLAAMAHGLPVLGTRSESTSEDLKEGENVLLVPPRQTDALVDRLRLLLSSPELRAVLAQGGLALSRRFAWKEIATEHAHLYNSLLQRVRRTGGT